MIFYVVENVSIRNKDIFVGNLTSTRNEDNSFYINGCKFHLIKWFYGVELDLKFTL